MELWNLVFIRLICGDPLRLLLLLLNQMGSFAVHQGRHHCTLADLVLMLGDCIQQTFLFKVELFRLGAGSHSGWSSRSVNLRDCHCGSRCWLSEISALLLVCHKVTPHHDWIRSTATLLFGLVEHHNWIFFELRQFVVVFLIDLQVLVCACLRTLFSTCWCNWIQSLFISIVGIVNVFGSIQVRFTSRGEWTSPIDRLGRLEALTSLFRWARSLLLLLRLRRLFFHI